MWTVAIADDEPYIREGLENLIKWKDIGCRLVFSGENGGELLAEIKTNPPDLVIVDIKMPVMNGLEIAKYIYDHNFPTKVCFLTAYADFQYAQYAIQYGVCDYIIKTSALEEIPRTVKRLQNKFFRSHRSYRIVLLMPAQQHKQIRKFFMHSFNNVNYNVLTVKDMEEGILITEDDGRQFKRIVQGCERIRGFCKNFLGEHVNVLCSYSFYSLEDTASVYQNLHRYGEKQIKNQNDKVIFLDKDDLETEIFEIHGEDCFLLKRIQVFIKNNYLKRFTLKDIADEVHVSAEYLSRFYKLKVGKNLFDTINQLRIEKAKALLDNDGVKIHEIATVLGFDDTSYFSKVFKKYVGCSPKKYQQNSCCSDTNAMGTSVFFDNFDLKN